MAWMMVAIAVSGSLLGAVVWRCDAFGHLVAIHAAMMMTAWGMIMPAGAVVARYFKVTAGQNFPVKLDNPFWWVWHRVFQYAGLAISTVALGVILDSTGGRTMTLHGLCGALVMILAWLQAMSTLIRGTKGGPTEPRADRGDPATWRGDHFDMTPRRVLFETWHKNAGWGTIVLAGVTMPLGIDLVGAPSWLMAIAGALQGAAAVAVLDSILRGRWVGTHVAIWGPRESGATLSRTSPDIQAAEQTSGADLSSSTARPVRQISGRRQRPIA